MDSFTLRRSVHENVRELRGYLGSHNHRGERTDLMPRDDLAELIGRKHPTRRPNGSTVQRWEEGTEPDIDSIDIMADLAGVRFEEFALGRRAVERAPSGQLLDLNPARDRKLTEADMDRALRLSDVKAEGVRRRTKQKAAKGGRKGRA